MLEIKGLHKRFGDVVALNGVDFEVNPGRITGFLGRNGAGKSTTMRSIFGLVNLDQGEIRWHGETIDDATMCRFGFLPEQRGLYRKMRIKEQVSYFAQIKGLPQPDADKAAIELLTELGLGERLKDKLEELSHGNQQRVQLATALAHDPELCVLDEPFNGLDPTAVEVLNDRLRSLAAGGKAVLFSSHQLDLIEGLCDDIVIIDEGTIRTTGTVAEVRQKMGYHVLDLAFETAPDWSQLADEGVSVTGTRTGTIRLDDPGRLDELLAAANRVGPLTTFSFDLPALTDVFEKVTQ